MEILAGIHPFIWLSVIGAQLLIIIAVIASGNRRSKEEISKLQEEIDYLESIRNRESAALMEQHKEETARKDQLHQEVLLKMKGINDERIGRIMKEFGAKLETIRLEASEYAKDFKHDKKQDRRVLAKAVIDRAEKFPMMLGCLRGMTDQMRRLKELTHKNDIDPESGEEPEAFDSFDEMNAIFERLTMMHRYFDDLCTEMRPYLINNGFRLPGEISAFITDFRRGKMGTLPQVSEDDIYYYYVLAGADVMALTGDLYGFGKEVRVTDNIDWNNISGEHDFKKGVLARRGFRLDE